MLKAPLDLAKARILVTNDDGIHAPGLKVLEKIARSLTDDVWVVAPETEQSGAAPLPHPAPAAAGAPDRRAALRRRRHADRLRAAGGASHRRQATAPDLVLSGVNRGANLGEDVTYSGTVAAAMEAHAARHSGDRLQPGCATATILHWKTAEAFAPDVVRRLVSIDWPKNVLMNINFPTCRARPGDAASRPARQGRRELQPSRWSSARIRAAATYYWIGDFANDEADGPSTDLRDHAHGTRSR